MQTNRLHITALITTTIILGCALALPVSAKNDKQQRIPIKVKGLMHLLVQPTSETRAVVHNEEDGQATHSGNYHNVGDGLMELPSFKFLVARGTSTAANGDKSYWVLDPATVDQVPQVYRFTGGTGRFASSTGYFSITEMSVLGTVDNGDGTFVMIISYKAEGESSWGR